MSILPIEPIARNNLILLAQKYKEITGKTMNTIGRYAHGDAPFFDDLMRRHSKWIKEGKPIRSEQDTKGSVTFRVYDKVLSWFKNNWPEGEEFPVLADLTHIQGDINNGASQGKQKQIQFKTENSQDCKSTQKIRSGGTFRDRLQSLRRVQGTATRSR